MIDTNNLMLLGIGGGGCMLVANVFRRFGGKIRALCTDTDSNTDVLLRNDGDAPEFQLLGGSRLSGHGAGGDPVKGREAAQDDAANVLSKMHGVRTVLAVSCLGAGTGSGATNELVKRMRADGITVICLVTKPFSFEGDARRKASDRAIPLIEEHADSLVLLSLDLLYSSTGEDVLSVAREKAGKIVEEALALLWRLLFSPGFIRLDAERLQVLASNGGRASLGFGKASGENRAAKALDGLCKGKLLGNGEKLRSCRGILLGILAGEDLRLSEIGEVMESLQKSCREDCKVEMGTVLHPDYNGSIELVALAFENATLGELAASGTLLPPVATNIPIVPSNSRSRAAKNTAKRGSGVHTTRLFDPKSPTLFEGENLDLPTYVRRGIVLER